MKKAQYGNTPINLPSPNPGIGGINKFANQCIRALQALRDRQVYVPGKPSIPGSSHPWKVTPNGDDTVTVNKGHIISTNGGTSGNIVYTYQKNDAQDLTVTGSGFIYYRATMGTANALDQALSAAVDALTATTTGGTLVFNAGAELSGGVVDVLSATYAYFPIAEVDLTDGVASVVEQIAHGDLYLSMQTVADG